MSLAIALPYRDRHLERDLLTVAQNRYAAPGRERVERMIQRADLSAMRREITRWELGRSVTAALKDQRGAFPTFPVTFFGGAFNPSAMHDQLQAYWKLEEASGQRNDSHGTNHLTDNNTVTQAAGKQGNAAQFTAANSETLSIADNAALSVADIDFTFGLWVYADTLSAQGILLKGANATGPDSAYTLQIAVSSPNAWFNLRIGNNTSSASVNSANISTATWYLVISWHDATANTISLQVNNGAPAEVAWTGGSYDDAQDFHFGGDANAAFLNGRLDEGAFWKRVLTTAERDYLYNSGNGRTYPLNV